MIDTLAGGGAERVVLELVRRLDRTRFDVAVCVTRMPALPPQELTDLAVPVHVLARKTRFDGFGRLRLAIRDFDPHVVHTHKEGSNTFGRICGLLERVPVIVAHEHGLPAPGLAQRFADCVLSRVGTDVLACSGAVAVKLVKQKWIPRWRVHVVRNGIDTDVFTDSGQHDAAAARKSLDGPIVAAVCRLDEDKDIATLLRAVPEILRQVPTARFVIAGDGPLRSVLERDAASLGILDRVAFLGHLSDVKSLFERVDIFVSSSRREGLPLAVLEAMSMGKPVVATSVGGVPEVVENGVTGLLVPPAAPELLAAALIHVLSDRATAQMMGQRGRLRAEQNHSVNQMVTAIERLYMQLLSDCRFSGSVRHATPFTVRRLS